MTHHKNQWPGEMKRICRKIVARLRTDDIVCAHVGYFFAVISEI